MTRANSKSSIVSQLDGLRFAWCRIPSPDRDPVPYYRVAIELPDGRLYWHVMVIADAGRTPDDWLEEILRHPLALQKFFHQPEIAPWYQV